MDGSKRILIPCAYKIIARVFSNRLKQVLPSTIALNQIAFVENRQILDASLIANELVDDWFHETKEGVINLILKKLLIRSIGTF